MVLKLPDSVVSYFCFLQFSTVDDVTKVVYSLVEEGTVLEFRCYADSLQERCVSLKMAKKFLGSFQKDDDSV